MKDRLAKLIDVKSIITFIMAILFFILAIKGIIDGPSVKDVFMIIIAFYFGTQYQKGQNTDNSSKIE